MNDVSSLETVRSPCYEARGVLDAYLHSGHPSMIADCLRIWGGSAEDLVDFMQIKDARGVTDKLVQVISARRIINGRRHEPFPWSANNTGNGLIGLTHYNIQLFARYNPDEKVSLFADALDTGRSMGRYATRALYKLTGRQDIRPSDAWYNLYDHMCSSGEVTPRIIPYLDSIDLDHLYKSTLILARRTPLPKGKSVSGAIGCMIDYAINRVGEVPVDEISCERQLQVFELLYRHYQLYGKNNDIRVPEWAEPMLSDVKAAAKPTINQDSATLQPSPSPDELSRLRHSNPISFRELALNYASNNPIDMINHFSYWFNSSADDEKAESYLNFLISETRRDVMSILLQNRKVRSNVEGLLYSNDVCDIGTIVTSSTLRTLVIGSVLCDPILSDRDLSNDRVWLNRIVGSIVNNDKEGVNSVLKLFVGDLPQSIEYSDAVSVLVDALLDAYLYVDSSKLPVDVGGLVGLCVSAGSQESLSKLMRFYNTRHLEFNGDVDKGLINATCVAATGILEIGRQIEQGTGTPLIQ